MSNLKELIDAGHSAVRMADTDGITYWTEGKVYHVVERKICDDVGDPWGYNSKFGWPTCPTFEAIEIGPKATGVTLDSIADSIVELVLEKLQAKLGGLK